MPDTRHRPSIAIVAQSILLILFSGSVKAAWSQVDVLTANYDNLRSNSNSSESVLSTSNVNLRQFGKVSTLAVDGYVYAQPLCLSGLDMPDAKTRNVVFVATMHNSIYAFDANAVGSPKPLWQLNFGPSIPNSFYKFEDIIPEVGILSTPVIDLGTMTLYAVANTLEGGHSVYTLHALDVRTGVERPGGGTVIAGAVPGQGTGSSGGVMTFDPDQHLQRPGLLLTGGTIYIAFGSHADEPPFHGWLFGYDSVDTHKQTSIWCVTPNGDAGSIWQGGKGPATDGEGNIFVSTANGDYDGLSNWGQSVVKVNVTSGINVTDWFTPDDWYAEALADFDLGSTAPMLLPDTNLLISGGKAGIVYLMARDNMGRLQPGNTQIVQSFSVPNGIYEMACWKRTRDLLVYMWGEGDSLKSFRLVNGQLSAAPFSENPLVSGTPYVGLAVSSDRDIEGTGILWATSAVIISQPAHGVLHAFDAADLSRELWNSDQDPRDSLGNFAKFAVPTIANGRVYVPTFSGTVVVYGKAEYIDPEERPDRHLPRRDYKPIP